MNPIKTLKMEQNFFSDLQIEGISLTDRIREYSIWKYHKLKEIRNIERKALDKETYLACGEESCGLRICSLYKVGPIH
jgi:hypothetical protein